MIFHKFSASNSDIRPSKSVHQSASSEAMGTFLHGENDLKRPHFATKVAGIPGLPQLSMEGKKLLSEGRPVVLQAAGDIAELGKPISKALQLWMEDVRYATRDEKNNLVFPRVQGEVFDYSPRYAPQFPIMDPIARSYGMKGPIRGIQVNGGRTIIDLAIISLITKWQQKKALRGGGSNQKVAVILDPVSWSGYVDLLEDYNAMFGFDFIKGVHAPVVDGHGLRMSREGAQEAIEFANAHGRDVIDINPIVPNNPSGEGQTADELAKIVELGAEKDIVTMIDALYSLIDEKGQVDSLRLEELANKLPPEVLQYLGIITGVTKATSSSKKTAELLWHMPEGNNRVGTEIMNTVQTKMLNRNLYPAPDHALATLALHTFPGGVHEALGERYTALNETRHSLRKIFDELGIPFTIGGSFYGMAALANPITKETLIRDREGRPVTDPKHIAKTLLDQHNLVGAQGAMFSPAQTANSMLRLSAAATPRDIERLANILANMKEFASKHQ